MRNLNCFLAGSKNLSIDVLNTLVEQGHTVKGVLSRDHEPGMEVWHKQLKHGSLKQRAEELGIPVFEKVNINSPEMVDFYEKADLDIMFSVFWREMVKEKVLNIARLGFFNLHTAYLPFNRGSFPLPWAIINDEKFCGLTIHKMLPGVDDGPIVDQVKVQIGHNETGASIYDKVSRSGAELFRKTLPHFANMTYTLTPFDNENSTYNPRGYPFGGQLNPYWSEDRKDRFKRALNFPPFPSAQPEPPAYIKGKKSPSVRILCGFDCDRPRGSFIASREGSEMGERKINSIRAVRNDMNENEIPRTFFICGNFLESMAHKFGKKNVKDAFDPQNPMVEIADHTYFHDILDHIPTRPDKKPMNSKQIKKEYKRNTTLFRDVFTESFDRRGFRTPLGHYGGLKNAYKSVDALQRTGARYISSDIRDEHYSLNPKLTEKGVPRQPYRYKNGMLEIPAHGWQDTAFSGGSKTKLFETPPTEYNEILEFYSNMFKEAKELAVKNNRDYFLGLVLHPFDVSFYTEGKKFFTDLKKLAEEVEGTFHTYEEVCEHYEH